MWKERQFKKHLLTCYTTILTSNSNTYLNYFYSHQQPRGDGGNWSGFAALAPDQHQIFPVTT